MDRPFGKNPRPVVLTRRLREKGFALSFHRMPTPTTYKFKLDFGDMNDLVEQVEKWGMIAKPFGAKLVVLEDPDE